MRTVDMLCAVALFISALVDGLLVPRAYTGRIWIFGTCLALLFVAMLNLMRIRNSAPVRQLKLFCLTANLAMLTFAIALMASIGKPRTWQHPQVALIGFLLLCECLFSLGKHS